MGLKMIGLILRHQNGLLASLFVVSIALASFAAGGIVGKYRVFPYYLLSEAVAGVRALYRDVTNTTYDSLARRVSEYSAVDAPSRRVDDTEALTSGLLWPGGEGLFREICPEMGCLAVELSSSGEVVHAYPYRLDAIKEWRKVVELPRGTVHPFQAPKLSKVIHAVRKYSNGDLLIVFDYANSIPDEGGVARIDRSGMPLWVREDYSHHWPTLFTDVNGEEFALIPGMTIEDDLNLKHSVLSFEPECPPYSHNQVDHVKVLGGDGSILQEIRIIDRIMESQYASMLNHSTSSCDLLHLNYIDRIRDDVSGMPGVYPGDYVVSFRNISSFGIMDSETGRIKRMVRGTFSQQHSVQHLKESKFLLFDNHGADINAGPSRILLVDLAGSAVHEQTIYPRADTPEELRFFSYLRGNISISQDRERMIIASSNQGIGLEVQLSDGGVLNLFRNIHDLSGMAHNLEEAGERAIYLVLRDLQYVE